MTAPARAPRMTRIVGQLDEDDGRDADGHVLGAGWGLRWALPMALMAWLLILGVLTGLHIPLLWVRP